MAMENLSIAQHCNTLHYARIRSGAYWPQLWKFREGNYVSLQRETPTTLDVRVGLHLKEVFPRGLLLLENKSERECREHSKTYAPCHLSNKGTVYPKLIIVWEGLPCFVCVGRRKKLLLYSSMTIVNMVGTWHACNHPWFLYYLDSGVVFSVKNLRYLMLQPVILNDPMWFSPCCTCPNGKWSVMV